MDPAVNDLPRPAGGENSSSSAFAKLCVRVDAHLDVYVYVCVYACACVCVFVYAYYPPS